MKETAPASTRPRLQADALKALANHDWAIATEHLALALIENPAWADGWLNLGLARLHLHQPQAAISALQRGIDLDPNRPKARCTLAEAWLQAGDLEAAAEAGRDECRRFPDLADNWLSLGRILERMGDPQAGTAYDRAYHLAPENPENSCHWARWLNESHQVDAAYRLLEKARARHPNSAPLEWQFAVNCFYREDWVRGFNHMDCRSRLPDFPRGPATEGVPLWQPGTQPRSPILLEPEQGLGDTIQFIRFIPELARRGHRVWLGCPKPLRTLLEGFPGVDRLLTNTGEAAGAGCRLPLMSLPSRLSWAPNLTEPQPYITGEHLSTQTDTNKKEYPYRIGWAHSGNPDHLNDKNRSLKSEALNNFKLPQNIKAFRVQPNTKTSIHLPFQIQDPEINLVDFSATARWIATLKLIITVDTSIAHLAGGMGIPVWILLPYVPDWRWSIHGNRTHWYKSAYLFRQKIAGNWQTVMQQIQNKLATQL
jgi:tetratricopeptide (TPR) repeat protein